MKVAHLFGGRKTSSRLLASLIQGEPRKWLICLEEGRPRADYLPARYKENMKVAHLFGGRKTSSRLLASLIQGEYESVSFGKTSNRLLASQIQGEYESGSFVWRKEDLEQITCQPDTRRI